MKKIYFSNSYELPEERAKFFVCDEEDYVWLTKFKWLNDGKDYAITLFRADKRTVKIRCHRLILGVQESKLIVDHKNGDRTDNRKSNLRVASASLNSHNRHKEANRVRLGVFRGVHYIEKRNKYEVKISVNGKNKYFGKFENAIDAAIKYDEVVTGLYGNDALTNFKVIEEIYFKMKK